MKNQKGFIFEFVLYVLAATAISTVAIKAGDAIFPSKPKPQQLICRQVDNESRTSICEMRAGAELQ